MSYYGTIGRNLFKIKQAYVSPLYRVRIGQHSITGNQSVKNLNQALLQRSYGQSTLRNYTVSTTFTIGNISGTSYGVAVGVKSLRPTDPLYASTYAVLDYSGTPVLQIVGVDDDGEIQVIAASSTSGLPTINTTKTYTLSLTVLEDTATATLSSDGVSKDVVFTYNFTALSNGEMLRPNIFNYAYGVLGNGTANFKLITVTTSEAKTADILFVGDSITAGYYSGSCENAPAYKLRSYTDETIQIMAGGGNKVIDAYNNIPEILAANPARVFLQIGTNDGSTSGAFATFQQVVTALTNAGIEVIPMCTPDGGNPATNGTYNHSIAAAYGASYINTWTTGWNTMSTGNGEMADSVHPTNLGNEKIAGIIKAARPDIFNSEGSSGDTYAAEGYSDTGYSI